MADTQGIVAGLQQGRGTVGRLLKDDEVYERVTATAREAQGVVEEARRAVQQGRRALESFQAKDGPTQGMAADLRVTLEHARDTLANMEENTQALKRNFFFRGFFKDRGYYDLKAVSPSEYRRGVLEGDSREALRIWLRAGVLFTTKSDGTEELTPDGRTRVESAMAGFLRYTRDAPLVVEGYSTAGSVAEEYIQARARAQLVLDHLLSRFGLASTRTVTMPLGRRASGSPDGETWDGVALALFVDREALQSAPVPAATSGVQGSRSSATADAAAPQAGHAPPRR
jgi:phospholipid/cholesterol/gamma-HCH transport system substrate-binding protein